MSLMMHDLDLRGDDEEPRGDVGFGGVIARVVFLLVLVWVLIEIL